VKALSVGTIYNKGVVLKAAFVDVTFQVAVSEAGSLVETIEYVSV
jgi:hypothetical protein